MDVRNAIVVLLQEVGCIVITVSEMADVQVDGKVPEQGQELFRTRRRGNFVRIVDCGMRVPSRPDLVLFRERDQARSHIQALISAKSR